MTIVLLMVSTTRAISCPESPRASWFMAMRWYSSAVASSGCRVAWAIRSTSACARAKDSLESVTSRRRLLMFVQLSATWASCPRPKADAATAAYRPSA